jgi:hypothetical protein
MNGPRCATDELSQAAVPVHGRLTGSLTFAQDHPLCDHMQTAPDRAGTK